MKIPVNRILPYSFVDGPGNRAVVFVQGCNISCLYCHNPETRKLCCSCGECVKSCPAKALSVAQDGQVIWDKERCVSCDTCIRVCQHHASPKIEMLDAETVMARISRSIPYIRGITVSGGECMLYPDFVKELFTLARKAKLSTLIDSNGTHDFRLYPELMEVTDGVMLDVKAWDDEVFMKLCHAHNDIVKKNLVYLYETGKLEEVRIVCLENYVDAKAVIAGVAAALPEAGAAQVLLKLIRFRKFGVKGELADHPSPDMDYMNELLAKAQAAGFRKVMIL